MIKLYMGGSPCTHWSIAQTKNRETEPSGLGWELFKNYLIGLEKCNPDYFLYENNKSMAPAIREQITKELGVEPILINSALVSAQNRRRYYWTNIPGVTQPEDRGLILEDILYPIEQVPGRYWYSCGFHLTNSRSGHIAELHIAGHDILKRVYSTDGKAPTCNTCSGGNTESKVMQGNKPRKLMPCEYARLQTVPDEYIFPVSNTQAYKMLGNGWTVDVVAHILSFAPGITTEPVEAFGMYDGMSCGHIALDKLGANVVRYYATEIDKYAIKTTQANYPETIQLGDAFQVRDDGWSLERGG